MHTHRVATVAAAAFVALVALSPGATAQATQAGTAAAQPAPAAVAALLNDVAQIEAKTIALAEAMPADTWDWRPGEGVRSVGEVVMHVAADNYFMPAVGGIAAPAETGIQGDDYSTAQAYERREVTREEALQALRESFEHLRASLASVDAADLDGTVEAFGSQFSGHELWIGAVTHVHEHLGQSIAYARMNGVVPPWSR